MDGDLETELRGELFTVEAFEDMDEDLETELCGELFTVEAYEYMDGDLETKLCGELLTVEAFEPVGEIGEDRDCADKVFELADVESLGESGNEENLVVGVLNKFLDTKGVKFLCIFFWASKSSFTEFAFGLDNFASFSGVSSSVDESEIRILF